MRRLFTLGLGLLGLACARRDRPDDKPLALVPAFPTLAESSAGARADLAAVRARRNEPSGFVTLTRRPFRKLGEAKGWDDEIGDNFDFVTVRGDTEDERVARIHFPRGWKGGTAPAHAEYVIPPELRSRRIYYSFWLKVSRNWYGHPVVSKINYAWIGGKPMFYSGLIGPGNDDQRLQARLQGLFADPAQGADLKLRPGAGRFSRDRWHFCEFLLTANMPGRANGAVKWWLDGTLVGEAGDIAWVGRGAKAVWEIVSWRPIWGGAGGVLPVDQDMYMRDFYLSAEPADER